MRSSSDKTLVNLVIRLAPLGVPDDLGAFPSSLAKAEPCKAGLDGVPLTGVGGVLAICSLRSSSVKTLVNFVIRAEVLLFGVVLSPSATDVLAGVPLTGVDPEGTSRIYSHLLGTSGSLTA